MWPRVNTTQRLAFLCVCQSFPGASKTQELNNPEMPCRATLTWSHASALLSLLLCAALYVYVRFQESSAPPCRGIAVGDGTNIGEISWFSSVYKFYPCIFYTSCAIKDILTAVGNNYVTKCSPLPGYGVALGHLAVHIVLWELQLFSYLLTYFMEQSPSWEAN